MREQILQASLGIDVSMRKLDCNLSVSTSLCKFKVVAFSKFSNDTEGFKELRLWLKERCETCNLTIVMEATGVYHQNIAYYLSDKGLRISVVQPTKAKQYAKSLDTRSKTDKTDARMLAQLGLERELREWIKPNPKLLELKILTRERTALKKDLTSLTNQLHAYLHSNSPVRQSVKRIEKRIALIKKQITDIEKQIAKVVEANKTLKNQVDLANTIPGVSLITSATVLAETDGFANIENRRQLVCYVGLDIVMKQSGTLTWKSRLSKRGNSYIRAALYMNAVCSIIHNKRIKEYHERCKEREVAGKTSIVAIERKLLVLIYSICKSGVAYDPDYGR